MVVDRWQKVARPRGRGNREPELNLRNMVRYGYTRTRVFIPGYSVMACQREKKFFLHPLKPEPADALHHDGALKFPFPSEEPHTRDGSFSLSHTCVGTRVPGYRYWYPVPGTPLARP
eukprot:2204250-Rhodomonas_salina.2